MGLVFEFLVVEWFKVGVEGFVEIEKGLKLVLGILDLGDDNIESWKDWIVCFFVVKWIW